MRETYFWLRVIQKISSEPSSLPEIIDEGRQLRGILSKSVATAKGKAKPAGTWTDAREPSPSTFSSPI
jgi:hypothetical protein